MSSITEFGGKIKGNEYRFHYFYEQNTLDRTRPLAVICASGQLSMIASTLLQRHGFTAVANVVGGMDAWNIVEWKQAERETE